MRLSILGRIMELEEGADNTLRDPHNSSYDTKAEFNNCFIIHSKLFLDLKTWLKHAYLHRSIDVKFIFDSPRLGLSSSANIIQIADVLRVVFLLFLSCFFLFQFLLLKRVKCPPFFKFTIKATQPRPQVFSVNGALTCKNDAFFTSFPR